MIRLSVISLALGIALSAVSATLVASAPKSFPPDNLATFCEKQKQVADVVIRLSEKKEMTLGGVRGPAGVFKVENHGKTSLTLAGFLEMGNLDIPYPEIIQEYRVETGSWQEYSYAPGSFLGPTDKLVIPPGGTGTFVTEIRTPSWHSLLRPSAKGETRIAYNDYANKRCIYSEIFLMDVMDMPKQ